MVGNATVINKYHFGMVGIPPIYGNIQDGYKNGFTTWKTWNLAESITHVNPKNLMQHIWKRPGDIIMLAHHDMVRNRDAKMVNQRFQ